MILHSLKMIQGYIGWSKRHKQKYIWSFVLACGVIPAAGMSMKDKRNQLALFSLATHELNENNLYGLNEPEIWKNISVLTV